VIAKLASILEKVRPPAFRTAICGHRGASARAPENTLAAFRGALEAGCDLVELDVLLTRDEHAVVLHDEKLGRTTGRRGRVAALTLEEIRACDAGEWFSAEFAGERVPLLAEALALVAGRAVPMVEVKQKLARVPNLVERVARALEETGHAERAILIVWEEEAARRFRARLPGSPVALIAFTRRAIRRATASGCDGVVPYFRSATRRFLAEAAAAGLFVAPWTVNRARDIEFFYNQGCDIVVTDAPEEAKRVIERLERANGNGNGHS
jgi:glycerophosphoryl diester phosphodiesterase